MEDKTLLNLRFAKTRRKKNTKAVSSYAKRQKRGGIKIGATFWLADGLMPRRPRNA